MLGATSAYSCCSVNYFIYDCQLNCNLMLFPPMTIQIL
uniref:Uncharacterized protein n=1 Tax=Arundo donax TaxID=35708 RepID=A0A0A9GAV0_ARUDO